MQRNPDGTAYEPRRVTARTKKGRIRRQIKLYARRIRIRGGFQVCSCSQFGKHLPTDAPLLRIARVHHFGLRDRVSDHGPKIRYAARRLLGVNDVTRSRRPK
jgi:phage virion morphogenesis protein